MTGSASNYKSILDDLKGKIKFARTTAIFHVNHELLNVYWQIGKVILTHQEIQGWGAKVIDKLAKDLRQEFPDLQGLSTRNLKYMRAFAEAYPNFSIVHAPLAQLPNQQQNSENSIVHVPLAQLPIQSSNSQNSIVHAPLAQLTWYHHITLLDKVKDPEIRQFYIIETSKNGWSRNMMVHQIESGLHTRKGSAITNFKTTLPSYDSDLVQQIFKDPYNFDFLQTTRLAKERELEVALIDHITKFLLELGEGFAFLGHQYHLKSGDSEFEVDLLFYHTRLRRYIVVDLKIGDFQAEFVGKMNLYLGLVDDTLKGTYDENSIGLILCKSKNKSTVEYALRDTGKPIGISQYNITELLPDNIKSELPSIEELEQILDQGLNKQANT
jgi:predicted nuclease of restriction endonuclease-like (RecB) superfamily